MRSPHALLAAALWFATATTEPPSSHAVLRSLALAEFRRTHPGERPAKIEAKAHAPSDAATDVLADLGREAVASALVAARGAVRRVACACHARGPDGRPRDVSGAFDVGEANATTPVVFSASYQLDGFVDRFFRERVAGLELACFYSMEMVGAVLAGRLLDDAARSPRANAKRVLAIFAAAAAGAYGVAAWLEALAAERADDDPVAVGFDASAACWLATTAVAALWGFADATIQTYCYWALGALYGAEADLARSVAFYKFVQSAGYCGGFALLPSSRCAYEAQLGLGAGAGALGVCLALLELPGDVR